MKILSKSNLYALLALSIAWSTTHATTPLTVAVSSKKSRNIIISDGLESALKGAAIGAAAGLVFLPLCLGLDFFIVPNALHALTGPVPFLTAISVGCVSTIALLFIPAEAATWAVYTVVLLTATAIGAVIGAIIGFVHGAIKSARSEESRDSSIENTIPETRKGSRRKRKNKARASVINANLSAVSVIE